MGEAMNMEGIAQQDAISTTPHALALALTLVQNSPPVLLLCPVEPHIDTKYHFQANQTRILLEYVVQGRATKSIATRRVKRAVASSSSQRLGGWLSP